MNERLETKLSNHELEIKHIKESLATLVLAGNETNKQLTRISESIIKQEIILEKLANIENTQTISFQRVHTRIDDVNTKLNDHIAKEQHMPCANKELIFSQIDNIKQQINNIKKIFWWFGSSVGVVLIGSILDIVLRKGGH